MNNILGRLLLDRLNNQFLLHRVPHEIRMRFKSSFLNIFKHTIPTKSHWTMPSKIYHTVPTKKSLRSTFTKETTSSKFCDACSSNSRWPPCNFEICSKLYNFLNWLLVLVAQSLCRNCLVFAVENKNNFHQIVFEW